ncbi:SpoIIE family protein phosphatase [Streptomyces spinoverrucosus]|nr:SpoIIE family protein phosphatase [Streptomyces spinoverrucosus]
MVVDGAGIVVRLSRQAEGLIGRGAEEVLGLPATPWLTRTAAPGDRKAESDTEVTLYDASGHVAATGLQVRPLANRDGSLAWAVHQAPATGTRAPDAGGEMLRALFTRAPVGLHILDTELRIVSANVAAQKMCDAPPDRVLGRHFTDVHSFTSAGEVETMLRAVLDSGEPSPERAVRMAPGDTTSRSRVKGLSAFRLEDSQGAVLGVVAALLDVGERAAEEAKARQGLRVLNSVRKCVGRSLDVVVTCQELADALVPAFADGAVVEVVDAVVRGEEPPLGPLDRRVPLRRAAFRYEGGREHLAAHPVGDVRALPFPTPYAQALADLKPRTVVLGADTPWLSTDPARARAVRASGAQLLLAVPLTLRGAVVGLMSLYRNEQRGLFDEGDLGVALEVAAHTSLCIDNARRYIHEHTIATTIQRYVLAPSPPVQPAVETASLFVPGSEGAGGFVDVLALPGARTALVVGEVAGRGVHTATTMGQLRTALHALAALDLEPDELLARLNDTVTRLAEERADLPAGDPLRRQGLAATCAYAVYDPLSRLCTIARAGAAPPVIAHPDGSTEILDHPSGPPLGSDEREPFAATTLRLEEGSIVALRTASLLRPQSAGAPGGMDALQAVFADHDRPLQDMCDDVLYRLRGDTGSADAILLLARTHEFPPNRTATWNVDHRPEAVRTARARARDQLTRWGVDDGTAHAAELVVSELVTNAIRYGAPPVRLRLIKDRTLTCEVHDASAVAPRLRHARTVDEGGRGLFICAQLTHNWGIRYTADGKTVWTEQALQEVDAHSAE